MKTHEMFTLLIVIDQTTPTSPVTINSSICLFVVSVKRMRFSAQFPATEWKRRIFFKVSHYILQQYKLQSTNFKLQSSNYKVQTTKCKVQSTRYKVQSTNYKVQSAKYRLQSAKNNLYVVHYQEIEVISIREKVPQKGIVCFFN